MAHRLFHCPDKTWLTEREFCEFLGISQLLFRRAVQAGIIPPARKWTKKTKVWHVEVVIWVSMGLKLGLLRGLDETYFAGTSEDVEED